MIDQSHLHLITVVWGYGAQYSHGRLLCKLERCSVKVQTLKQRVERLRATDATDGREHGKSISVISRRRDCRRGKSMCMCGMCVHVKL